MDTLDKIQFYHSINHWIGGTILAGNPHRRWLKKNGFRLRFSQQIQSNDWMVSQKLQLEIGDFLVPPIQWNITSHTHIHFFRVRTFILLYSNYCYVSKNIPQTFIFDIYFFRVIQCLVTSGICSNCLLVSSSNVSSSVDTSDTSTPPNTAAPSRQTCRRFFCGTYKFLWLV